MTQRADWCHGYLPWLQSVGIQVRVNTEQDRLKEYVKLRTNAWSGLFLTPVLTYIQGYALSYSFSLVQAISFVTAHKTYYIFYLTYLDAYFFANYMLQG